MDVCPYHGSDCDTAYGYCHCGCEQRTGTHINHVSAGITPGTPHKYIIGHWNHRKRIGGNERLLALRAKLRAYREHGVCPYDGEDCAVGAGKCHCGCGEDTNLVKENETHDGVVAGMPRKVRKGHAARQLHLSREQVRQLRYEYATSDITQEKLAAKYGISQAGVSRILNYHLYIDAGIATGPSEPDTEDAIADAGAATDP